MKVGILYAIDGLLIIIFTLCVQFGVIDYKSLTYLGLGLGLMVINLILGFGLVTEIKERFKNRKLNKLFKDGRKD